MMEVNKWIQVSCLGLIILFLSVVLQTTKAQADPSRETQNPMAETDGPPATPLPQVEEPIFIRVNVPATRLDLYIKDKLQKSFPVAIGTPKYPTPIRDFHISYLIWNPWWLPPDSDWAQDAEKTPPGPRNPLGVVKMLMEGPMRIHGTNSPRSIGRAASHACLRMLNRDAREVAWEIQKRYSEKKDPELLKVYSKRRGRSFYVKLFESVPVQMVYSQVERQGDRLLLHPNPYGQGGFQGALEDALLDHPEILIDKKLVKRLNKLRRGKTVEVSIEDIMAWGTPHTPLNPNSAKSLSVH